MKQKSPISWPDVVMYLSAIVLGAVLMSLVSSVWDRAEHKEPPPVECTWRTFNQWVRVDPTNGERVPVQIGFAEDGTLRWRVEVGGPGTGTWRESK